MAECIISGRQGPKGENGPQGATGLQGPRGETGPAGQSWIIRDIIGTTQAHGATFSGVPSIPHMALFVSPNINSCFYIPAFSAQYQVVWFGASVTTQWYGLGTGTMYWSNGNITQSAGQTTHLFIIYS